MELNFAVGKINFVLPNFIQSTFNTCIKTLNACTLILKHIFEEHKYYNMSLYKFSRSINSTKVSADLAYEGFITKFGWLSEAR